MSGDEDVKEGDADGEGGLSGEVGWMKIMVGKWKCACVYVYGTGGAGSPLYVCFATRELREMCALLCAQTSRDCLSKRLRLYRYMAEHGAQKFLVPSHPTISAKHDLLFSSSTILPPPTPISRIFFPG